MTRPTSEQHAKHMEQHQKQCKKALAQCAWKLGLENKQCVGFENALARHAKAHEAKLQAFFVPPHEAKLQVFFGPKLLANNGTGSSRDGAWCACILARAASLFASQALGLSATRRFVGSTLFKLGSAFESTPSTMLPLPADCELDDPPSAGRGLRGYIVYGPPWCT